MKKGNILTYMQTRLKCLSVRGNLSHSCCSWSHGLWPKKLSKLVWRCHQLLSEFLAKGHLPRVSLQPHLLANDKGDNEMIPGLCTDLLALTLKMMKTPENLS